ncbi:DUF2120 family protein [Methanosphaera sp. BMS]|uniref:DUF2120 family protein n=1 Tax=Methanosphaera sp. BMS TaxID=1789762 RepID=UPI000DC1EA5B|nr:DUF2120 family protein [Methanosphaera sp. BMS]AWX32620.1 hypothetical protein AW729_05675 [Methanosphaera sp. BMS]
MEVIEVSRQIMEYLGVFKGSKPVLHNTEAMIIKGKTHDKLKQDEIIPKLEELFEHLNIRRVYLSSQKAKKFTDRADKKLRKVAEVYDESAGISGLERMKMSFEMTGCVAEYMIGEMDSDIVVYVMVWFDKSEYWPMFVESAVIKLDPEDDD